MFQIRESFPKPGSIERIDREHSNTALCTSGATGEPIAASAGSIGERGVHNLNQCLISPS
jgi:hypothetical protein